MGQFLPEIEERKCKKRISMLIVNIVADPDPG
jgi:hypothetical protein